MAYPEIINVTVVPAQEGYRMIFVDPYSDDDIPTAIPDTWMADIIGWRVISYRRENGDVHSVTEAITLEGTYDSASYAILCPRGTVDDVYNTRYANLQTFLNAARETQEAAIARGLIKKAPDHG